MRENRDVSNSTPNLSPEPPGAAGLPSRPAATSDFSQFLPVQVPILPWKNAKLLSQALGDTVYVSSAFATALRLELQLGVPAQHGEIGVRIPLDDPASWSELFCLDDTAPQLGRALRAEVSAREMLENPQASAKLLSRLAENNWYGLEIEVPGENLDSQLIQVARRAADAGLHPALSVLPGALHSQNQGIMSAFETISLDLLNGYQPRREQLKYLATQRVVGKIIDAKDSERTNLEAALETLVLMRAKLDSQSEVAVGIAGHFGLESLTLPLREDLDFVARTRLAGAREKIFEALDLANALTQGKTTVASAFVADVLSRAGKATSLPV